MPVTIVTKGLIGLYRDGALISNHTIESKAIEGALSHAEANGNGDYELRYPNKAVTVSLLQKTVIPFSWNTVTISFNHGTPSSVSLATFLRNEQGYPITYGVQGALPAGVTLAGGVLNYDGQAAPTSAAAVFTASSAGFVATSEPGTVAVAVSNVAPYWSNAPSSLSAGAGTQIAFGPFANDPDGDVLTFSLTSSLGGYSVNPSTGVVTVGNVSGPLTIRVTDPDGLSADWLCAVTISAALYRWHPGHYMHLPNVYNASQAEINTHLGYITALGNEACIKGVAVELTWQEIEPAANSYNWNRPDQYMDHIKSMQATRAANNLPPLRLMFVVHERRFNTATLNTTLLPADLYTNPVYQGGAFLAGASGSSPSSQPKLYVAAVMDRYINIYKKLIDRYDDEPLFEMLYTKESTLSPGIGADWPAGYSHAAMHTQWRRFLSAIGPYRTYCNLAWNANYLGGTPGIPDMETSIDTALAAKVGIGGPDIYSDNGTNSPGPTQAEEIYLGRTGSTPHDYRGELGMFHQEDEAGMNGGQADQTIDQVYTWAVNTLRCTHIWWRRGTLWSGTVLPYLRTHPNLVPTAPAMYGGQIDVN